MVESTLNPDEWDGRCVHSESTLHQLSPFLGKMKSSMAKELVRVYSDPGDTVLDPFCGSGTIPLEANIENRNAIGIDRNPYSVILSKAKLNPPNSKEKAIEIAVDYLDQIDPTIEDDSVAVPEWVSEFFHPKTLSGLYQLFPLLRENDENFILACLLGILHHQRPGFLSYPASHLKPYLRDQKFPRENYPEKYEYREIRPRLIAKIERAYRRFPDDIGLVNSEILSGDTTDVIKENLSTNSVDAVITSPPYMNKLDYGRDNRLRLYFLGIQDYTELDGSPESKEDYREFLVDFLSEASRALRQNAPLVFVLGESKRSGSAVDTSEVLSEIIRSKNNEFEVSEVIQDKVPVREINSMSSETETILSCSLV